MSSNKETDLRKQSYNYRVNYTMCNDSTPTIPWLFQGSGNSLFNSYTLCACSGSADHKIEAPVREFRNHSHDAFFNQTINIQ